MTEPGIDVLYNNTLSAYAISAAWELGLLERLERSDRPVDLAEFARQGDLHPPALDAIGRALALAGPHPEDP